ncbi:unnamed protein product [Sphagnum troendelagicum]|uniref:Uncharacterized protein n=1 Tax=Sphagnum troendelagicum TaxID=128251 RepID=A0ABP0V3G2_9BRYO
MPLTASAVDVLGIATLVLVIVLVPLGLGCVWYVLYFQARIQKERPRAPLLHFNALWIVRVILILLAMLWSMGELLRLRLMRRRHWLMHSFSFQWQGNMCRLYIISSLGFLEPCFFLTALFLVHRSLRKTPFTPRKAWNGKVVAIILSCCLPVFLLQLFFVVISPSFEFKGGYSVQKEGYNHRLPNYFTMTFDLVMMDNQTVAVCQYPLLSILVLAVFVLLCTTVGEWILIIHPIADALAVCSVFVSSHHLGQESTGGGRSLSTSFPAFVSDDDQVALVQHGQMHGTDLNSNLEFVTVVNTFMPVDHRGSFSDQNEVAFPSPDYPELPGKPLLSDTQKAFIPFL